MLSLIAAASIAADQNTQDGHASPNIEPGAAAIYDERFCRMWEFYLAAVELEFLHGSHMVFQLLLSTKRDAVPITRDFMVDSERAAWARTAG